MRKPYASFQLILLTAIMFTSPLRAEDEPAAVPSPAQSIEDAGGQSAATGEAAVEVEVAAGSAASAEERAGATEVDAPEQGAEEEASESLASGDLSGGETIEILELGRTSGGTLTLKFAYLNGTDKEGSLLQFSEHPASNWDVGRVYLLDMASKKKYLVMVDSEGNPICSRGTSDNVKVQPGASVTLWAKFQAPPIDIKTMTISVPNGVPFEDIPIAEE